MLSPAVAMLEGSINKELDLMYDFKVDIKRDLKLFNKIRSIRYLQSVEFWALLT
jgi:hypothetical protein